MFPSTDSTSQLTTADFDQNGVLTARPAHIACPRCRKVLVIGDLSGCQFAGCPDCKGMLFQKEVFANLIRHLRSMSSADPFPPTPMNASELAVRRLCPTCGEALETHSYAGPGNAVIDSCFPCAIVWLDATELNRLVRAPGKR